MKSHALHALALLLALSGALVCAEAVEETRLWSSRDGLETVEARLYTQDETTVTLITSNGTSRIVSKSRLSEADNAYLDQAASAGTHGADPAQASAGRLARALEGRLYDDNAKPTTLGATNADTKFLFYYSASWCPPCRAFTPDLVRFARRHDDNLQVVLIPSDKTLEKAAGYLDDYRMPWPLYDTFENSLSSPLPRNPNGYIPTMVLTDADGKVLLANSDSLSRDDFLDQAADMLD